MKRILAVAFIVCSIALFFWLTAPQRIETQQKPASKFVVKKRQLVKEVTSTEISGKVEVSFKPNEVASPPSNATVMAPTRDKPADQTVTK